MSNLALVLNGVSLPTLSIPFKESPMTKEADNVTLNNTHYTDFTVDSKRKWDLVWEILSEEEYDAIYAIWRSQYETGEYPTLVVDMYDINTPVRMILGEKDIRKDGCDIRGVEVTLIEERPESLIS